MEKTKLALASTIAIVALMLGGSPVQADVIFQGHFYDTHGNAGSFTLVAVNDGGNQYTAIDGSLEVTSGDDVGFYDLYSIGDNPGAVGQYSPTGNFFFDNNFYQPGVDPALDTSGLLFVNDGFGAVGVAEISFWGPVGPPGNGHYSFWSSGADFGSYLTTSDTATFLLVPEPSTFVLFAGAFGLAAAAGGLRRRSNSYRALN